LPRTSLCNLLKQLAAISHQVENEITIVPTAHSILLAKGANLPLSPTPEGLKRAWANFDKGQKVALFKKKQAAINALNDYLCEIQKTELALHRLGCYEQLLEGELTEKVQNMTLKQEAKEKAMLEKAAHDPAKLAKIKRWKEAQQKMTGTAGMDEDFMNTRMRDVSIDESIDSKSLEGATGKSLAHGSITPGSRKRTIQM